MNIGIVTTWFERGAAYVSRQFLEVLSSDHDVFIYARGGEEYGVGDPSWDFSYVTWGKRPKSFAPTDVDLDHLKSWLQKNDIEVVLYNEQKFWAPVLLCRELGIKTGSYIDYYTEKTVPLFGIFDFLICNTKKHLSVFDWHPQCFYFPWGTDTELFKTDSLGLAEEGLVTFFHSAGMSPYRKGTDLLIQAFAGLEDRAKLIVHSQVNIVDSFPDLSQKINRMQSNGSLEIVEKTVSAPGLYHLGDVYVYPSRLEGIGLTIMEAASCGLQVVVPDNGPMNEFVIDGISGRTVSIAKEWARWDGYYWPQCEVSVHDLRSAMNAYVTSMDDLVELKAKARKYATEKLDWRKNSSCLSGLISSSRALQPQEVSAAVGLANKNDQEQLRRFKMTTRQIVVFELEDKFPLLIRWLRSMKSLFIPSEKL